MFIQYLDHILIYRLKYYEDDKFFSEICLEVWNFKTIKPVPIRVEAKLFLKILVAASIIIFDHDGSSIIPTHHTSPNNYALLELFNSLIRFQTWVTKVVVNR
jgi:hypothetical protein